MLFFVLLVIILFVYLKSSDNGCVVFLVILLVVYGICLINVTGMPTNLLASKEKIEEKREYIMSLPGLPMSITDSSDVSIVEVDVMNSNLATDILSARLEIYSEIRGYNRCIYFWQANPKFAFFVWGWPNPTEGIKKLDLQPISISP